jgi:hypothetical protein
MEYIRIWQCSDAVSSGSFYVSVCSDDVVVSEPYFLKIICVNVSVLC